MVPSVHTDWVCGGSIKLHLKFENKLASQLHPQRIIKKIFWLEQLIPKGFTSSFPSQEWRWLHPTQSLAGVPTFSGSLDRFSWGRWTSFRQCLSIVILEHEMETTKHVYMEIQIILVLNRSSVLMEDRASLLVVTTPKCLDFPKLQKKQHAVCFKNTNHKACLYGNSGHFNRWKKIGHEG